jgi:hypothetical protein
MKLAEVRFRYAIEGLRAGMGLSRLTHDAGKKNATAPEGGWELAAEERWVKATKDGRTFLIPWEMLSMPPEVLAEPAPVESGLPFSAPKPPALAEQPLRKAKS